MKNIIFFVPYLNFINNWIDPIFPFLAEKGYNVVILHIQSLSFGIAPRSFNNKMNYGIYDVGKVNIKFIISLFRKLNPEAIVFLHFKSFADFLMLRLSKSCGLKTIYIQHGLFGNNIFKFIFKNKKSSILRYMYLTRLYIQLLHLETNHIVKELHIARYYFFYNNYRGTKCDYAILYSEENLKFIQKMFDFSKNQVKFSGYPLVKYQRDLNFNSIEKNAAKKTKVFFIKENMIPFHSDIGYEEEKEYFRRIIAICAKLNYELILKLHPREEKLFYDNLLHGENIKIMQGEVSLHELIEQADIVIGHVSTALFGAILLRKPIIILYYPGFKSDKITNMYETVGQKANSDDELYEILAHPETWDQKIRFYDNFIEERIGENNSYEHQAMTIIKVMTC